MNRWQAITNWTRQRVLGATLAAASTLTLLSLITPWWADFFFDVVMVMLIAVAARMHRGSRRSGADQNS